MSGKSSRDPSLLLQHLAPRLLLLEANFLGSAGIKGEVVTGETPKQVSGSPADVLLGMFEEQQSREGKLLELAHIDGPQRLLRHQRGRLQRELAPHDL